MPTNRVTALLAAVVVVALGAACTGRGPQRSTGTPVASSAVERPTGAPSSTSTTAGATTTTTRGPLGSGQPVTIAFAGDVHYEGALAASLRSDPPAPTFDGVQPVLAGADLTIVNLETAVTTGGTRVAKEFNFRAPPAAIGALVRQGVDVIAMANNHALDYGQSGLADTMAAVEAVGAPVIGVGRDEAQAYRPFVAEANGQRIGFVDASQVINGNLIASWTATPTQAGLASAKRVDRLLDEVRRLRPTVDTVVVFLHWGTETQHCPNAAQFALAPQLVAAGADVIAGSHAHRVQGAGYLGQAYVAYGLGNFQFLGGRSAGSAESGILTVSVTGRRVDGAVWSPARIGSDGRPTLLGGAESDAARARWEGWRACAKLTAAPTEEPPPTP